MTAPLPCSAPLPLLPLLFVLVAVTALPGCEPQPARVKFDGPESLFLTSLDPLQAPGAVVLDGEGKPLDLTVALTVEAVGSPPTSVLVVEGTLLRPRGRGDVVLVARAGKDGPTAMLPIAVRPLTAIAVACPRLGCIADLDGRFALRATAKSGAEEISDVKVRWSSSDAGIASVTDAGEVSARGPGKATITATVGLVSATVDVTIRGPVDVVEIVCPGPIFKVTASAAAPAATPSDAAADAGSPVNVCFVTEGGTLELVAVTRSAGTVVTDRAVTWRTTDPDTASVSAAGTVTPFKTGAVVVEARVGNLAASVPVEVKPKRVPRKGDADRACNGPRNVVFSPLETTTAFRCADKAAVECVDARVYALRRTIKQGSAILLDMSELWELAEPCCCTPIGPG